MTINVEIVAEEARTLMTDQCYDAALACWREVIVYGPIDAFAHLARARCLAEIGAQEEALEDLETAVALDEGVQRHIEADWVLSELVR